MISLAGNTWAVHGWDWRGFGSSTGDYDLAGKIAFSAWVKSSADGEFIVNIQTNAGLRGLWYYSNATHGTTPYWVSGSGANERACFPSNIGRDGVWRRIERNLQQDISAAWPGETLVEVRGLTLAAYTSSPLLVDELRFSNAMTTEHVVIAPGSVGHIARQRATNPGTYAHTDRYFHYDQVGAVLCETDSAGALAQTHHQDAFGNTLASWSTGYLGGDKAGFHHNTKEYDVNVEMVYMYQRWYSTELGVFASRAPYFPLESAHGFAFQSPMLYGDPNGEWPEYLADGAFWSNLGPEILGGIADGSSRDSLNGFASGGISTATFGIVEPWHDPCNELQNLGATIGTVSGTALGIAATAGGGTVAGQALRHVATGRVVAAANVGQVFSKGSPAYRATIALGSKIPAGGHPAVGIAPGQVGNIASRVAIPAGATVGGLGAAVAGNGLGSLAGGGSGGDCP